MRYNLDDGGVKMKKIALYSVIIVSIILSIGCNQKTQKLHCTIIESSYENLELQEAMNITFKGNKVIKMSIYSEIEISGSYMNIVDDLAASLKEHYADLEGKKGIEFKTTNTDNILSITINADLKKMNSEAKNALGIGSVYQSLKDTKKELENEGYTCD